MAAQLTRMTQKQCSWST